MKTENTAERAAQTGNGGENAGKNGATAGTLVNSLPAYGFASFPYSWDSACDVSISATGDGMRWAVLKNRYLQCGTDIDKNK